MKIGQEVMCIDATNTPLQRGGHYVVRGIQECGGCGTLDIDIGMVCENETYCPCGHSDPAPIYWYKATRFRVAEGIGTLTFNDVRNLSKENVWKLPDEGEMGKVE